MTHTPLTIARTLVAGLALFLAASAMAAKPPVNVDESTAGHAGGPAISGFDPVAYFTESKPVQGSDQFSAEHDGATWQFSSQANLDLFKGDPAKYAPQYGGYCAYAVSKGSTAPIDPDSWTIHDGKLYLNYNASIQARWSKDIPKSISVGDGNWPSVLN